MKMFRSSLCALRSYPLSTCLSHAWARGVEREGAKACGGAHHILYQKPKHRQMLSTLTPHSQGQKRGEGGGGKEGGGFTWREGVEYGLKGLAVVLLTCAVWDEILSPWHRARQKIKELQVSAVSDADAVTSKSKTEPKEGEKRTRAFSSAKCSSHGGSGSRTQQYNFLAEAVAKAAPSVVFIEKTQQVDTIFGRQVSVSTGSGFIVHEDGYVVTNAHVVGSTRTVSVKLASGKMVQGEVTDLDQVADLALVKLRVKEKLPALEFGSSASVRPGEWVVALGSPLSLSNTITAGIVSSCHRPSTELGLHHNGPDMQYVQTDAPITVGNSGGPLVNLDGEVIGVNTLTAGPGISFAIPSDFAKEFVSRANKTAHRPGKFAIGISMLTVTPDLCHMLRQRGVVPGELEHGVFVAQVWASGIAAQAGLQKGDVIVRINGTAITSSRQVYTMVQSGKRLHMEIVRSGSRKTVTLTPEKM